ncbi:bifunctional nuclease family protein [Desulfobotulus mexicanus]|uniref:bifunctional nuclease family protein n=1 Tax=Desulfobotulus mexicanus TaxID=2586642 RepID=UPI0015D175C6|nr:bifunctional nuclease family protein [Desulfobotulus mexicanus]
MFRVEIVSLSLDPSIRQPVLILKKYDSDQAVPLVIGHLEAAGIAAAIRKENLESPMTHDLFASFIRETGYRMIRAEVTSLKEGRFSAKIFLGSDESDAFSMDSRPSDAISLALRFEAPIFMAARLFGQELVGETTGKAEIISEAADTSEEGRRWLKILEKMDPEHFGHA